MRLRFAVIGILSCVVPLLHGADAAKGKELFRGCAGCHNYENDVRKTGPSLRTLFGKVTLRNGTRATEANVRALIQDGFNGMPSYRYQFREEEFDDLIAFLKTLNSRPGVEGTDSLGKVSYTAYCVRCHSIDGRGSNPGGVLRGLFQKEKLANDKPVTDRTVLLLIEEGHGGMTGTKNWLDAAATKALLAYVKSL